jgi:hypothetical protein
VLPDLHLLAGHHPDGQPLRDRVGRRGAHRHAAILAETLP